MAQTLNVTAKAEVSLKARAADAKEKKLIGVVNLNGSYERQDLTFDMDKIGESISDALTRTIERLMNDEELKKKLQWRLSWPVIIHRQ